MEILAKLGIDWKILIAQIVNFVILFVILRRYAFRPMLTFLEERSSRIEKGIQDADDARTQLQEAEQIGLKIIEQAKVDAHAILEKADAKGKLRYESLLLDAKNEIHHLMEVSRKKLESEQSQLLLDAKSQLAHLVMLATEKVVHEKIDAQKDKELIEKYSQS